MLSCIGIHEILPVRGSAKHRANGGGKADGAVQRRRLNRQKIFNATSGDFLFQAEA